MKKINIDREWTFRRGFVDSLVGIEDNEGITVNLPHDGMISTEVSADAPAGLDSGYFCGDVCNYTKYVDIPKEWENECVGLKFDGAMMHVTVDVNGCKVSEHHYGYSPFYVDISEYVSFGGPNRITINANTGVQSSSRWYTGSGLYRSVFLTHGPRVHVENDGIFVWTKEVSDGIAYLEALVDVCNETVKNRMVEVKLSLCEDGCCEEVSSVSRVIEVPANDKMTARMAFSLKNPKLWDAEEPNLYLAKATVTDMGEFRTRAIVDGVENKDSDSSLFGIRIVTADATRGLRVNGKTVKLKGGCLHHDNGLLGAVSLYEIEARKVALLKESGFNAIRTTHNPPSLALIEACDRLGMYVFDEAFDAWGIAKRVGDYSNYFEYCWESDLTAFVRRDRVHPCVIMWSTGNEIPERGGLNKGYLWATKLAEKMRSLDGTRPVSNAICSYWCGLDDYLSKGMDQTQNSNGDLGTDLWEKRSEPFTNGLDVVGYNYMEDLYVRDHELFPDRVILGSENFPQEIGYRWPMVEALPYVIGEFTWTAWDYIGEAGIGKALYLDKDDPIVAQGPWAVMPYTTTSFPWRTANDADFDITGRILPQGEYRKVVWGSSATYLYAMHPKHSGKSEVMSKWGFPEVMKCWNFDGFEGKPVELVVFSNADEVELVINGESLGRIEVDKDRPLPNTVRFLATYEKGRVEAVSYKDGVEVSRDILETTGEASALRISPVGRDLVADGHDALFVNIEAVDACGRVVPSAEIELKASVSGVGFLSGFGTGRAVTAENYTDDTTTTYKGQATLVVRSGYEKGTVKLVISGDGVGECSTEIEVK